MLGVYSSCVALAVTSFGADGGIPKYYILYVYIYSVNNFEFSSGVCNCNKISE